MSTTTELHKAKAELEILKANISEIIDYAKTEAAGGRETPWLDGYTNGVSEIMIALEGILK